VIALGYSRQTDWETVRGSREKRRQTFWRILSSSWSYRSEWHCKEISAETPRMYLNI